jgi:NAD(P)-dependent dehydrogenase (short-subunit alcohol dehydrogenase family)
MTTSVIVGGSSGLGRLIAERLASLGDDVIVTSRDLERAAQAAAEIGGTARTAEIGGTARGLALDLARPHDIAGALASLNSVDKLVITAFSAVTNSVRELDITAAVQAITVKLIGYTETVRCLHDRFTPSAAVVLFGGIAKDRPYPGSTIVTAHNGGVSALVRTLAIEIAPHRVNAIHPGVVGDSPRWRHVVDHPAIARTPIGRLVTMDEVADATEFLLTNGGMNAQDLAVDGGVLIS